MLNTKLKETQKKTQFTPDTPYLSFLDLKGSYLQRVCWTFCFNFTFHWALIWRRALYKIVIPLSPPAVICLWVMFAQLTFIAEENLIIHTNIIFITRTSGQARPHWAVYVYLLKSILMIISSGEIITGQHHNEYLGEFQMENCNLEDNQSVRSNLSLIQVAPTPTFATGNWIIMTGSLMENIKHPTWCQTSQQTQIYLGGNPLLL